NTLRLLPGGGARGPADPFFWRVMPAATGNKNHKTKNKTPSGNIKKKLSLSHFWPFVFYFYFKNRPIYKQPMVKQNKPF
ncbi:hypothetical protein, partial [Enterobacter intestinihominis]